MTPDGTSQPPQPSASPVSRIVRKQNQAAAAGILGMESGDDLANRLAIAERALAEMNRIAALRDDEVSPDERALLDFIYDISDGDDQ